MVRDGNRRSASQRRRPAEGGEERQPRKQRMEVLQRDDRFELVPQKKKLVLTQEQLGTSFQSWCIIIPDSVWSAARGA